MSKFKFSKTLFKNKKTKQDLLCEKLLWALIPQTPGRFVSYLCSKKYPQWRILIDENFFVGKTFRWQKFQP